ncbi:MAG: hypothetical protein KF760_05855 [Candidatus Eremiobacteraeota bacterium]|nr:hypothetical protein [Candidatus Eremiobacteraeota bacterium]MCW5867081.1 hypothetical protein [Candidatus Eremiobacteraeota bacterium]
MNIPPIGPDRFGNSEPFLTPPPQLGGSLERLQEAQAQQQLLPLLQLQQKNAAMLLQMMQILSTLMGNQEAVPATSAETNLGNFDQHSSVLDGSQTELPASELGERLAQAAERNARAINTPGLALREVTKVLRQFNFRLGNHQSCFQLVGDLRQHACVQEVQVQRAQLPLLPPGAIVVWDKAPELPQGHVSISLGQGWEASSTLTEQQNLNANLWVFMVL